MLLYEYPPKLSRSERQQKVIHDLTEHKKMRRNMFKNFILGAVIIAISFLAQNIVISIVLLVLGVLNIAVGALLYWYFAYYRAADVYTRIYDDHIEHSQRKGFSKEYLEYSLFYDSIKKSYQTNSGVLICELADVGSSELTLRKKDGTCESQPLTDRAELTFQDTAAKLYLIDKLSDKIKYPRKEYNVIDDDEDDDYYSKEDKQWDKLHKHGL
ncbi:MAG: hypothetical protein IJ571_09860 [Ruminococcus sp.]|nr:hypothetical protein [Ruminococcus sp.]